MAKRKRKAKRAKKAKAGKFACTKCEKSFPTEQGVIVHGRRAHPKAKAPKKPRPKRRASASRPAARTSRRSIVNGALPGMIGRLKALQAEFQDKVDTCARMLKQLEVM